MNAETAQCPKCDGQMVQGFVVDFHAGGKRLVASWVEGDAGEVLLACHECPGGQVHSGGYLPLCRVRLPGVVRTAGVRRQVTPHLAPQRIHPAATVYATIGRRSGGPVR